MRDRMTTLPVGGTMLVVALVLLWVFVGLPYLPQAGWLFDDFHQFPYVGENDIMTLLTTPINGNYRPLGALFWHYCFSFFGWERQWAYPFLSFLLHTFVAFLVVAVLRQYRQPVIYPYAVASLFLLFSPVNETVFWAACQFDLLAVCLSLLSVYFANRFVSGEQSKNVRLISLTICLICGAAACFAKEAGLATIFYFFAVRTVSAARFRDMWNRENCVAASVIISSAFIFLAVRWLVMGARISSYGDPLELYGKADLFSHLIHYARYMFTFHHFDSLIPSSVMNATSVILLICIASGLVFSFRKSAVLICCAAGSLIPVLWTTIGPAMTTAGGRLIYIAVFPLCCLIVLGAGELYRFLARLISASIIAGVYLGLTILVMTCLTVSFNGVAVLWREASCIAHTTIEQVKTGVDPERDKRVYVEYLPHMFLGGPYILKCYTFSQLFRHLYGHDLQFRCSMVLLRKNQDGRTVIGSGSRLDPFSNYLTAPEGGETYIKIDYRSLSHQCEQ